MKVTKILAVAFLVAAVASTSHAQQVLEKKTLTLAGAKKVIAAAVAKAKELNAPGAVIAIVDDGGNLMALERLDNTFAAGALISYGKARTSAIFKRPTAVFEKIIREGRTPMVALNDFTPLQGGVPIEMNGQTVGAIGVSGAASAQQDEELAIAGASALSMNANGSAATSAVTFFDSKTVAAAFIKGQPLLENGEYKIHVNKTYGNFFELRYWRMKNEKSNDFSLCRNHANFEYDGCWRSGANSSRHTKKPTGGDDRSRHR